VLRSDKLASVALALILGVSNWLSDSWALGIAAFVGMTVIIFILKRFGVVSLAAAFLGSSIFSDVPMTLQPSAWYSSTGYAALIVIAAICLFAFRTSLGGRPLLDTIGTED
jgi:membrane-bound acyltransferase YfiQ involved in biofilm formation